MQSLASLLRASPMVWATSLLAFAVFCGVGVWAVCYAAAAEAQQQQANALATARHVAAQVVVQLTSIYSPVEVLSGMVQATYDYDVISRRFTATAPSLLAAANGMAMLLLAPSGMARLAEPAMLLPIMTSGPGGADGFLLPDPDVQKALQGSLASRAMSIAGPSGLIGAAGTTAQGGLTLAVFKAIFVTTDSEQDNLGRPDPPSPACGEPCAYRNGSAFWGFSGAVIDLNIFADLDERTAGAPPSPLRVLRELGYAYELVAANGMKVATSASPPHDPVQVVLQLPGTEWVLHVGQQGSWTPSWLPGAIVGVVAASILASVLLFTLLVSRRRNQLLLEALLPKHVIQGLHQQGAVQGLMEPRKALQDSPAELLHSLLDCLAEGGTPDLRDVVLLRSLMLQSHPWYSPMDVGGKIRSANLDSDVERALMRQLGNSSAPQLQVAPRSSSFGLGPAPDDSNGAPPALVFKENQAACGTLRDALALVLAPEAVAAPHQLPAKDARPSSPGTDDWAIRTAPDALAEAVPGSHREGLAAAADPSSQGVPSVEFDSAHEARQGPLLTRLGSSPRSGAPPPPHRSQRSATASQHTASGAPSGGQVLLVPEAAAEQGDSSSRGSPRSTGWVATPGRQGSSRGSAELPRCDPAYSLGADPERPPPGTLPQLAPVPSGGAAEASRVGEGEAVGGRPVGQSLRVRLLATLRGSSSSQAMVQANESAAAPSRHSRPSLAGDRVAAHLASSIQGKEEAGAVVLSLGPAPAGPTAPMLDQVEGLLSRVDALRYDTWALAEATGGHALSAMGFFLLQREGLVARFSIPPVRLIRLLHALEAGYPASNPYHNATHAADVLRTLHVLLRSARLTAHYVDPLGLLAAYFAAIVHDHGHPGLTGDFLVATSHPLALRYNDRSPLENRHAASAFVLLAERPDLDVLSGLSRDERSAFRKQVIEMVIATDMKQHFALLGQFNAISRRNAQMRVSHGDRIPRLSGLSGPSSGPPGSQAVAGSFIGEPRAVHAAASATEQPCAPAPMPVDDAERMLSLQVALKCADIGHLAGEMGVHKRWLAMLEEEFFRQGDRERELGLPISPLFDRAKQGVSKSQVGFFDFVALPLLRAFAEAFPGGQAMLDCFEDNYRHWQREQQQQLLQDSLKQKSNDTTHEKDRD